MARHRHQTDDTAMQRFITIQNLGKHFGAVTAVDNVDLDIERGEFFALLGPSGCGKTTLLRMLGGFEAPTSGEIRIDGQSMRGVPPHARPVNTVFQNYAIFPHLNVRQNIAFGLRKEKLDKHQLDERIDDALRMVRLDGYESRSAHELSGGQRQRVALARALIKRPKVLLLDEPLGALDKQLREQMQLELRELQRSLGTTFVFVTHDQEEALTMSDRIAVMSGGRILESGTPQSLYTRPQTRFVAGFLGAMNFFGGTVKDRSKDGFVVAAQGLGVVDVPSSSEKFSIGDVVTVGLRPENIIVDATVRGNKSEHVAGTIKTSAFLGDRTHVFVHVPGSDRPVVVAMQNMSERLNGFASENASVSLSWARSSLLLLDVE